MKNKKQYTVFCETNIKDLNGVLCAQVFTPNFETDSLSLAQSVAAGLQRINHSWCITSGGQLHSQWIREGFRAN